MAEVTSMRNNATPYPVYGVAWAIVFPMLDADGDLVTGATTPDAEVSKNGDTFADCTNESTEIATNSGVYYLLLTAAEMTADIVTVIAKSATAGMKTTTIVLYPRKLVVLSTGTCQGSNDTGDIQLASGDSAVDDTYNGCLCVAVIDSVTEARIINDYVGSTKVAEVSPAWNTAQPDSNDTYTIYLPEGRQVQQANTTHLNSTAQTARDIGASVLLSSGTGTGQLKLASGYVAMTWADIAAPTTTVALTGTTIATTQKVDVDTIKTNPVVNGGTLTFPSGATLASTTNITAGTITTVTTLTGHTPQTGDSFARLTGTGAVTFASLTVSGATTFTGAITGTNASNNLSGIDVAKISGDATAADNAEAFFDGTGYAGTNNVIPSVTTVTGNVNGDVLGSVSTIANGGINSASFATGSITSDAFAADAITNNAIATAAAAEIATAVWAAATRLLTAGTNIVLAKGTGVTGFTDLSAADVRTAVGLASANLDTQLDAIPTVAEIWTTALTEAYRATGATGTAAQLMYEILQNLTEFAISSTTKTVKKLDGSTTAKVYTLSDATNPTGITETS